MAIEIACVDCGEPVRLQIGYRTKWYRCDRCLKARST